MISFRPYDDARDFDACVSMFQRNTPEYFSVDELEEYTGFLKDYSGSCYWVFEIDNVIAGCGGIRVVENTGTGRLIYGMLDPAYHAAGYGKALLEFRLGQLVKIPDVVRVKIDTSNDVMGFFTKFGFIEDERIKDRIGLGMDQVKMTLLLDDELKQRLLPKNSVVITCKDAF